MKTRLKRKNTLKKFFKSKVGKAILRPLKYTLYAATALHLGTQLNYWMNMSQYRDFPHPNVLALEAEFKHEFAGDLSYLENGERVSDLAEVLAIEYAQKPFTLESFRIESPNYLKKYLPDQLAWLIGQRSVGYCFDGTISVVGTPTFPRTVAHHEVKHQKYFEICKTNMSFNAEWRCIAKRSDGTTPYRGFERFFSYIPGLCELRPEVSLDQAIANGCVTSYASLNLWEDVAELCEEAQLNPEKFIGWIYTNRNDRIAKKVELAQKYGLIPKEFSHFIRVEKTYSRVKTARPVTSDLYFSQLAEIERFLDQHPHSVYEGEVRLQRANAMRALAAPKIKFGFTREEILCELETALTASPKTRNWYPFVLQALQSVHRKSSNTTDQVKYDLYQAARLEYNRRYASGDVLLPKRGVNDFLATNQVTLSH